MQELPLAPARKRPPGAWLYWLAAALWLLVPLAVTALAIPQVVTMVEALEEDGMQVDAPGTLRLTFQAPGDYAIYASGDADTLSASHRGQGVLLQPDMLVTVRDESGRPLPLQMPGARTTVSMGATQWVRVASFSVSRPGSYMLEAQHEAGGPGLPMRLLVASGDWPFAPILEAGIVLLPLLAVAFLCIVLGVGLSMYVYVRRYDARNAPSCAP